LDLFGEVHGDDAVRGGEVFGADQGEEFLDARVDGGLEFEVFAARVLISVGWLGTNEREGGVKWKDAYTGGDLLAALVVK
jgi:hypothetical protein